jgi:hypothetical protein
MGAKYKIEIPTKINAIAQVLIQINRKLGLNPKLIETITNVTKKVVIKLIKVANLISSFVFNWNYFDFSSAILKQRNAEMKVNGVKI